ncbi:MAG: MFS transporter [Candidatus Scalindua rubra]|uniref:Putative MFS-type transporter YcaD n=1 Tax=Candidatus Scalindua brodae TaxID=237368 RepID=A0A0B0ES01_9BACT|nr:MAG: putative MFS-type transporter YcaD [Candidatus Scalindua brodae]MBZ0109972.1 MFS transporter [Candidatus Scalindua rubra]
MKSTLTKVTALLFGVAILLTGQGLQGTLVPTRAALEDFSTVTIGVIGASYFLGFTIGCLRGGELLQAVGHVRVFAAMTAAASATPLVLGLWTDPWLWGALRFLTGFCFAVLYMVIESWLNGCTSNETRGGVFSIYIFIKLTVMVLGQLMMLMYDPRELELFVIASVLVSSALIPVVLLRSEAPEKPQVVHLDLRRLFKISPSGATSCFAAGLTNGSFWTISAIFASQVTGDTDSAAWYMTSGVIGGAICQWPLGILSDRLDRRRVLAITALSAGVVGIVLALGGARMPEFSLMLLGALWGGMAFPLYSVAVALTNDHARHDEYVQVSGGLLLLYGIGAVAGPLLAALMMGVLGSGGLYVFSSAVHLSLFAYIGMRALKPLPIPTEQQSDFGDALTSTQTALLSIKHDDKTEDLPSPT